MLFETSWGWTWDFDGIYNQFEMIFVRVCLYTLALFKSTVEMFLEKCHGPHVTYTYYIPNVSFTWTHGSWGDSVLNVSSTYPVCILNVSWTYPERIQSISRAYPGERIFLAEFQKHTDRWPLYSLFFRPSNAAWFTDMGHGSKDMMSLRSILRLVYVQFMLWALVNVNFTFLMIRLCFHHISYLL